MYNDRMMNKKPTNDVDNVVKTFFQEVEARASDYGIPDGYERKQFVLGYLDGFLSTYADQRLLDEMTLRINMLNQLQN